MDRDEVQTTFSNGPGYDGNKTRLGLLPKRVYCIMYRGHFGPIVRHAAQDKVKVVEGSQSDDHVDTITR